MDETGPDTTIVGAKAQLGPLRRDLVPLYQRWVNNLGTQRTLGGLPIPITYERELARYNRLSAANEALFTIYVRETGQPIGITELKEIDRRCRTANFVIFIGEPGARGRGYGTETTLLILDYAFTTLGLHNVDLQVYECNLAGLRAYERAGFRTVGRRRQSYWMGGRFWDTIYMDCLASEFVSPAPSVIFVADMLRGANERKEHEDEQGEL
ncbi:MAG TPA: GNAT family protein [Thermomicrobiales bacterium]|jgi:RimJ/RimL family protein N-acetyltransferase